MNTKVEKGIVYFDGICGLCNNLVDFLIRIDRKDRLLFAPLQGETASQKNIVNQQGSIDTVIFQRKNKTYYKSEAALRILYHVGGFWKLFIVFIIVPPFIRNFIYDVVAKNRYNWFGKKDSCRMPTKEERKKFLL